jgi:hypothetical protein
METPKKILVVDDAPTEPAKPRSVQRRVSPLAAMMLMAGVLSMPMEQPKPKRKCLLPTCNNLTDHNGGYCCAEHCREHKRANEKLSD